MKLPIRLERFEKNEDRSVVWKDYISTVFDTADQLLILEPDGTNGYKRTIIKLISNDVPGRANEMKEQQIDVLICGAISRPLEKLLISFGICVFAFVRGPVEEVLAAYKSNRLEQAVFTLPGCRGRMVGAGRNRMRGSRCPWRQTWNISKQVTPQIFKGRK